MTHIEILEAVAQNYGRPRYLEIGTGDGGCFYRVARHCCIADTIDVPGNPYGDINRRDADIRAAGCLIVTYWGQGSDDFFLWAGGQEFELIFIDGSHWYEQVKRDLENSLDRLAPNGTIVMHDTWAESEDLAKQGSDEAYLVAEEMESDPRFQTFTLPIRPGLTFLRPNTPRWNRTPPPYNPNRALIGYIEQGQHE